MFLLFQLMTDRHPSIKMTRKEDGDHVCHMIGTTETGFMGTLFTYEKYRRKGICSRSSQSYIYELHWFFFFLFFFNDHNVVMILALCLHFLELNKRQHLVYIKL